MNQNLKKILLFMFASGFLLLAIGYHWGGRPGLLFGFLLTTFLSILIFFFGDHRLFQDLAVKKIEGQDHLRLMEKLKDACRHFKVQEPHIYIFSSTSRTCFCLFGNPWQRGGLYFSESLLTALSEKEIQWILWHQVQRLEMWNSFFFTANTTLAYSLLEWARFLDRLWKLPLIQTLIAPLSKTLIRMVISSKHYLEMDQKIAEINGNALDLSKLLWKLSAWSESLPFYPPKGTEHLFMVYPNGAPFHKPLLSPFPPLNKRLQKLCGHPIP